MKVYFRGSRAHPPFTMNAVAVRRTAEPAPEGVHVESWHGVQSPTRNPLYPGETLELRPEFSR